MRFVFLDIEGVIINDEDALSCSGKQPCPGRPRVNALNRLLHETCSKIVVTSYLRYGETKESLAQMFTNWGVLPDSVYDRTISTKEEIRGQEIREWIDRFERAHGTIESYVILDDEISDMLEFSDYIVQPDTIVGLTEQQVDRASAILRGGVCLVTQSPPCEMFASRRTPLSASKADAAAP